MSDSLAALKHFFGYDRFLDYQQEIVERIVSGKMEEGQFEQADISIRELGIVKETLKQYLSQIHHERIVYPQKNQNNDKI